MQTYIDQIVQGLVGLLVVVVLGVVASLRVKVKAWLDARTTAQEREILHRLATEGMALVEAKADQLDAAKKLDTALQYVLARMNKVGINVDPITVKAAIEKAVLDYNAKIKGGGAGAGSDGA